MPSLLTDPQTRAGSTRRPASEAGRTLVHETWGDHAALLARTDTGSGGSVGKVEPRLLDVVEPSAPLTLQLGGTLERVACLIEPLLNLRTGLLRTSA